MKIPGYIALTVITMVAGLALGGTYTLTEDRISEQALIAAENARKSVFEIADAFNEYEVKDSAGIDWCYEAKAGDELVGYVAQKTVNGFAGPVEVIAGVDLEGKFTGISVGGAGFKETAGLGEKTKRDPFTSQYDGKVAPVRVVKAGEARAADTIDAVTAATISSRAVTDGANAIADYIEAIASGNADAFENMDAETGATGVYTDDANDASDTENADENGGGEEA